MNLGFGVKNFWSPSAASMLRWLSALTIAIYIFDVPRFIIDVWRLPLPPLGGNPPYLFAFAAVLLFILIYIGGRNQSTVASAEDYVAFFMFMACSAIATWHWFLESGRGIDVVFVLFYFYSGYVLCRIQITVLDGYKELWWGILGVAVTLALVHGALLVSDYWGGPLFGANGIEFRQRNGISLALLMACFLIWFAPLSGSLFSFIFYVVPLIAIAHVFLNQSRGAMLILVMLICGRFIFRAHNSRIGAIVFFFIACISVAIVTVGADSLIQLTMIMPDGSDDQLSALARIVTNREVVRALAYSPFFGLGDKTVAEISYLGHSTHTYLLVLTGALGVVGLVAFGVILVAMVFSGRPVPASAITAISLLLLVTIFVNDLFPWFAALIAVAHGPHVENIRIFSRFGSGEPGVCEDFVK